MPIPAETWRWLASPQGQEAIACAPAESSPATVARLRKRFGADQVFGILETSKARRKACSKLDPKWANTLLGDIAGVEMASSARSSIYKAGCFGAAFDSGETIADLCCGIGADAWGLHEVGLRVVGVDIDETRTVMFEHNLPGCEIVHGDALTDCPADTVAFHLDPARRAGTKRTLHAEDFMPAPDVWKSIMKRVGSGAIKLNPGIDAYELPEGEVEIISEMGTLTQAVLWVGKLAGEHPRRASVLDDAGALCSISGEPFRPTDSHEIGEYIGTLDPCVERADLVGELLDRLGVDLVHPGTGLVTCETQTDHAMVRWYRVLETLPWNEKRVRSALRSLNAGVVEIRTRGGVVNPDEIQRKLRGSGDRDDLSVLIYRLGDRVVSVIAQRLDRKTPAGLGLPASEVGVRDDN